MECASANYSGASHCYNVFIGYAAGRYMDGAPYLRNTAVGARAFFGCDSASQYVSTSCVRDNIYVGAQAGARIGWYCENQCGIHENIGIGYAAHCLARCSCCAIAIGSYTLSRACNDQVKPIAIGPYSGNSANCYANCYQSAIILGPYNSCWGNYRSIAIGTFVFRNGKTSYNIGIGYAAACNASYSTSQACSMNNIAIGSNAQCGGRFINSTISIGTWAHFCMGFCKSNSSNCTFQNIAIGNNAGSSNSAGTNTICALQCTIYIGSQARLSGTGCIRGEMAIGACSVGVGNYYTVFGNASTTGAYVCGTVTKGSGTFQIVHPNPKKINKWLHHSFTESPNAGDNLYRYKFNISNCEHCFKLPNYYKYLNTCNMAWVYPTDHFGQGHAKIDDKKENLIIKTDTDGCYTVLLMGTRCDAWALKHWQGTERHKRPDMWSCNIKKYGAPK
jgi:hypothetical protein